jgi:erythromycin esterase
MRCSFPLSKLALAAAFAVNLAAAELLPAKNLAFDEWDQDKASPVAWMVGAPKDYGVSRDCEVLPGRCVVRLESRPDTTDAKFLPVFQNLPATSAAGSRWKLSGLVKTRDVSRWAGFWIRVDGPNGPLKLDNMSDRGPRGTTAWKRFEAHVDVPVGARQVAFGLILGGKGTAWFDGVTLEADHSVAVAALPTVDRPPRPAIDQGLLDDAALMLPRTERASVRDEWSKDVATRARPIRSLFSDDFSDLQFLKPLLEGKRVIQLGESGHGVAEFNWMKVRLIKFLHREMGFDVVAFESSLSGCDVADERLGKSPALEVMRDCIFSVWHSSETLGLFEYLDASRRAGLRINLAGFDTQNSGRARPTVAARLKAMAGSFDAGLASQIEADESRFLNVQLLKRPDSGAGLLIARYEAAAKAFRDNREALLQQHPERAVNLAIQELQSRVRLVRQLVSDQSRGTAVRDEGMANNLDFLLDTLYPGRKVIVWAHNFHIAKELAGKSEPFAMGSWVAKRRAKDVYTIGLFMGRGTAAWNDGALYEIASPPRDTLEAVLSNAGLRMCFVDFTRAASAPATAWIFDTVPARDWGTTPIQTIPARSFDAVLYIDRVTPPAYL